MKNIVVLFFLSFCSYGFSDTYKAAVIEHYPLMSSDNSPKNTILKNLEEYRSHAGKAHQQGADIAVFPEYGLTTVVLDNPEDYATEITTDNDIIKELKAIAVEHILYLVVNLLEKEQEPNKKTKYYNTNLVFDRNGSIITKYRKINLFNEKKLTPGPAEQNITFTTDFGVTFATFICFDILHENPSRTVLENNAVTDIVYPTAWFSTMPFFTALSVQHGYAVANGVNLLAANYGKAKEMHGGSGIYLADGKVAEMYISDSPSSKPLIQPISKQDKRQEVVCASKTAFGLPSDLTKSNVSNYVTDKEFKAANYKLKKIDLTKSESKTTICDSSFCCNFTITINTAEINTSNVYKVMAYDGPVSYGNVDAHVRVCSLVSCENESDDSCGARSGVSTKFTKITVEGNLITDDTHPTYYTPVTLNSFLQPLTQTSYCNSKNGTESTYVKLSTTRAQKDVIVFGILGITTASSASSLYLSSILFLTILSVVKNVLI